MAAIDWNPGELLKLSGSYWETCVLHAGVKLDLFTPLADGPCTAAELSKKLVLDKRALIMLLDALVALQLLKKQGNEYVVTESAAPFLDSRSPGYLGHIIMHHHYLMEGWGHLDEAVRSGAPVRKRVTHEPSEDERKSFLLGMLNLALLNAPKVVSHIDLTGRRKLLDLGGGPGTYAIHFCRQNPQLNATVYDLPSTQPFAEATLKRFAMSERIDFIAGDFHEGPLPGGFDVAWLSHILHGEGAESCSGVLHNAVAALEPGGVLFVQDFILNEERTAPLFPALFSLNMLLGTPDGKSYSELEIVELLQQAGLSRIERLQIDLPNGAGIMYGHKAET